MSKIYKAKKLVRGKATARAIVCPGGFSFMGDVDVSSGVIVADGNPNKGLSVSGRVLIYKETKGSSGGSTVLVTLANKGIAPVAIITMKPADYNIAEGAILCRIPFMWGPDGDLLAYIKTGQMVRIDSDLGLVEVIDTPDELANSTKDTR